jgi:regulatory protein
MFDLSVWHKMMGFKRGYILTNNLKEAQQVAMKLLAGREHSRYELRSKLAMRKFAEDVVDQVLNYLEDNNLQNDGRFTEAYMVMKMRKGFGPVRVKQEMHDRGISAELIEEYLADDEQWIKLAIKVRTKKFGADIPKDFVKKTKQMKFLQYRGFTAEQIKQSF